MSLEKTINLKNAFKEKVRVHKIDKKTSKQLKNHL